MQTRRERARFVSAQRPLRGLFSGELSSSKSDSFLDFNHGESFPDFPLEESEQLSGEDWEENGAGSGREEQQGESCLDPNGRWQDVKHVVDMDPFPENQGKDIRSKPNDLSS